MNSVPTRTDPTDQLSARELAMLGNELRLACMRISRRVRFENTDEIPPHQFSVLARLNEHDELTPGELAELERVSAPSMTKTVAGLVDLGLVERRPCPHDGRQVKLRMSANGRSTFSAVRRRRDAWMIDRLAELDPAQQQLLREATRVLTAVAAQ